MRAGNGNDKTSRVSKTREVSGTPALAIVP